MAIYTLSKGSAKKLSRLENRAKFARKLPRTFNRFGGGGSGGSAVYFGQVTEEISARSTTFAGTGQITRYTKDGGSTSLSSTTQVDDVFNIYAAVIPVSTWVHYYLGDDGAYYLLTADCEA